MSWNLGFDPLLLLLTVLALSSCHQNAPTAKERHREQILSMAINAEPPSLDPARSTDTTSSAILHMLFEGLTRPSIESTCQPAIAKEIDVSPDRKTYVFHLRKTYWSNGDPLTAHDFEYAWKRILAPDFPAEYASSMYPIKGAQAAKKGEGSLGEVGVKAIDDNTLEVKLHHPHLTFLDLIQQGPFLPVHRASVERNPNWAWEAGPDFVSNGPFTLDQWKHHNLVVVKHNPLYWDSPSVRLNSIVSQIIEVADTELALFENGDLDWSRLSKNHPAAEFAYLKATGKIISSMPSGMYYYVLNVSQPPFHHVKMRQAFSLAIHRQAIVDRVLVNDEQIATRILPHVMFLTNKAGLKDNDIANAQRLFQEALYEMGITKEQLPSIILTYANSEHQHKIAQIIQNQWKDAFGVDIQLCPKEWKVFLDQLDQKNFMIAGLGIASTHADPFLFLQDFAALDSRNQAGWHHPEYRQLIEKTEQMLTPADQKAILLQAETLLLREMPVIPIYNYRITYLRHPNLKNVLISPTGRADLRYAYFENSD